MTINHAFDQTVSARRILHFLAKGPAVVESAAKPGQVLLHSDFGTIAAGRELLTSLGKANHIAAKADGFQLTARGQAALKADAPEQASSTNAGHHCHTDFNATESPLAGLYRRKTAAGKRFLTEDEFDAGERLRADFTRACLMPRITSNWNMGMPASKGAGRNGAGDLTDCAVAARQRVNNALSAVGPELSGVMTDVCCFLKGLETVERERQWPARSAKLLLKMALGSLHRHYYPSAHALRDAAHMVFHWGSDDYRPSLKTSRPISEQ